MLPLFPPYPATEGLSVRVTFVLNAVVAYVAARMYRIVPGGGGAIIPAAMGELIGGWVRRRRDAIVTLIGRIEAGTVRPYRPRAEKQEGAEAKPPRKAGGVRLPAMFGWLCALGPEARGAAGWLVGLLEEADMKAMVLAHPRLASLFRPVLWMLGQEEPDWLPRPPRRVRPTRPRATKPAWWRERPRERPEADAAPEDPWRELERFAEDVRDRDYVAGHRRLYAHLPPHLVPPCIMPGARRGGRPPPPSGGPDRAEFVAEKVPPRPTAAPGCRLEVEMWEKPVIPVRERSGW
jgi:hypothetical protein